MKINMVHKDKLEQILNGEEPVELLRAFAVELNNSGLSRQEIYDIYYSYQLELQESSNEAKADMLGDVMDMITGWYVGRNLNLS